MLLEESKELARVLDWNTIVAPKWFSVTCQASHKVLSLRRVRPGPRMSGELVRT